MTTTTTTKNKYDDITCVCGGGIAFDHDGNHDWCCVVLFSFIFFHPLAFSIHISKREEETLTKGKLTTKKNILILGKKENMMMMHRMARRTISSQQSSKTWNHHHYLVGIAAFFATSIATKWCTAEERSTFTFSRKKI